VRFVRVEVSATRLRPRRHVEFKYTVGFLLTSFGIFWTSEGVGIDWPGATRLGRR
jgi:uncharacterized membrane protein